MMLNQKQIAFSLQVLLWLWFGIISSFVAVNVVNIAKLQTENKLIKQNIDILQSQVLLLKYQITNK